MPKECLANVWLTIKLLWIFGMSWGLGHSILRRFGLSNLTRLEDFSLSLGLGLGSLSFLLLGQGLLGLYQPVYFAVLVISLTLVPLLTFHAGAFPGRRPLSSFPKIVEREKKILTVVLGAIIILTWLAALSPPTFYDALMYHLGVPNLYLLRGKMEHLPTVVHSNFPFGMEMLYVLGTFMGGVQLAGLINFGAGLLSATALAALAQRHWGNRTALTTATIYYSTPMIFLLSHQAGSENALSFYFLLTLLCLYRWQEEHSCRWVMIGGIFGGLAFGSKYIGGLFAVLLPFLFLIAGSFFNRFSRDNPSRIRAPLLFLLCAAAAASPWLLKNLFYTGNPVYPAFFSLLGGEHWGAEQSRSLHASAHAVWGTGRAWKDFFLLPWHLVTLGRDLGASAATTWFWPLTLIGSMILLRVKTGWKEKFLLASLVSYLLLWAASFWMARFLLPATGLGALIIALGLHSRDSAGRSGGKTAIVIMLLVLFNTGVILKEKSIRAALQTSLGLRSRQEYLRGALPAYPPIEFINTALPHHSRILLLGETMVAYLQRDYVYNTAFDKPLLSTVLEKESHPDEIGAALSKEGLTHVLVNFNELRRLERKYNILGPEREIYFRFASFLDAQCRLLYEGHGVRIFELPAPHS